MPPAPAAPSVAVFQGERGYGWSDSVLWQSQGTVAIPDYPKEPCNQGWQRNSPLTSSFFDPSLSGLEILS